MVESDAYNRRTFLKTTGSISLVSTAGCINIQTSNELVFDGESIESFVHTVEKANEASNGKIIIEEGQYRFDPYESKDEGELSNHAVFEELENITIEGNGATLLFTEPLIATIGFVDGKDITIKNLSIDYDPVPFTQGTIQKRSKEPLQVGISLDDGFPSLDHRMFEEADEVYALVHEPNGEFIRGIKKKGSWDPKISGIKKVGDRLYELQIHRDFQSGGLKPNRKLTILARNNMGGIFFYYVENPTLQNVSIHATNGGAFAFTLCDDPSLKDCVIAPPQDSKRHIGANADGIRIINCLSSAEVAGCRHEYLGDDSLVVQHTLSSIDSIIDAYTLEVEDVHPFVVKVGDILDIISPNGERKGSLPPISEFEARYTSPRERKKPKTVSFDEPIADQINKGDFLRNRATGSQNFVIRDNEFRHHRANLIRIAASHGTIENNTLEGCPINPIELETDIGSSVFSPKGWSSDITVRDNEISLPGMNYFAGANPAGIHVHLRVSPDATPKGRPNRDIDILNNSISEGSTTGIHVASSENIRAEGNEMTHLNQLDFPGFGDLGVSLDEVSGADVVNNKLVGSEDDIDYFGMQKESEQVLDDGNQVIIDGESQPGEVIQLQTVRFDFNQTVRPSTLNDDSNDDRPLAFRCQWLQLLNEIGEVIVDVNVGTAEEGVSFGKGVYHPSQDNDWRWFGGSDGTTKLSFADSALQKASRLRIHGYPMDSGISSTIQVEGTRTDKVSFGPREAQTYDISLMPAE